MLAFAMRRYIILAKSDFIKDFFHILINCLIQIDDHKRLS